MAEPRVRPILFSAPMVRAILAGEKTVTRRVVKWRVAGFANGHVEPTTHASAPTREPRSEHTVMHTHPDGSICGAPVLRTPAMPGDRLWVRETWCPGDWWTSGVVHDPPEDIRYAADNSAISYATGKPLPIDTSDWSDPKRWRPSIFMPRWASRLALDVITVRVERLHDITNTDAMREGIVPVNGGFGVRGEAWSCGSARAAFSALWRAINGESAWRENPWVWRVEFTRAAGAP